MQLEAFNWTKFSLVRVYLVAAGRGNCGDVLAQMETGQLDSVLQEFRDSLEQNFSEDNRRIIELSRTLDTYPEGSLADELSKFYHDAPFPKVGEPNSFPARYIFLHDAHHILLDSDTSEQGELEVIAFEGGLIGSDSVEGILPVLAQVFAFAGAPDLNISIPRIAKAWEIGCKARTGLLENWDIYQDLALSVEDVRSKYNVFPLSEFTIPASQF